MVVASTERQTEPNRIRYEMAGLDEYKHKAEQIIGLHRIFDWIRRLTKRIDYTLIDHPMSGVRIHFNQSQYFGLALDELGYMLVAHESYGSWMATAPFKSATLHHHTQILSLVTANLSPLPDQPIDSFCIQFECAAEFIDVLKNAQTVGFAILTGENNIRRINRIVAIFHDTGIGNPL